tara:strand:- start:1913 stop:4087 length:2175 start_codon:yes stop_codon:yes gene_type:complete
MNILDIQDNLKNFSEKQLINEMQMPSGNAPQFLVLSEITRRKRMRDQLNMQKAANEPTVAQEAVASAGVPVQGIMGMSEAMAPKAAMADGGIGSVMSQPMKSQMPIQMRSGGLMQSVPAFKSGGSTRITERRMKNGKIGLFRGNTFLGTKDESGGIGTLAEKIGFGSKRNVLDSIKEALGFEEGGVIKAQNGLPLGLRQRNPGNIRPGANFIGESGAGGGYATFGSDDEGLRAIQRLLMTYGDKYGINTLRGFANRYAPPSDNNPTGNYIDFLASKTGIDPDAEINLAESGSSIIPAIVGFEQGQQPYTQAQIDRAISAAGTDDPAKVAEILGQPFSDDILNQRLDQEPDMLSSLMGARADDGSSEKTAQEKFDKIQADKMGTLDKVKDLFGIGDPEPYEMGGRSFDDVIENKKSMDSIKDNNQFIIDGINAAINPMAIRGLGEQYYGRSPEINAALEAKGYKPQSMAVTTTEEAKATKNITKPDGKVIKSGEIIPKGETLSQSDALENNIPAEATGGSIGNRVVVEAPPVKTPFESTKTDESETKTEENTKKDTTGKETTEAGGVDPNKPIYSPQAAGAVSSLESEILAMQKRMKKSAEQDKWLSLAQAGLALMSSTNPTLLGALGEAGISGLSAMKEAESRYQEGVVDLINARAKLAKNKTGMTAANAVSRLNKVTDLLIKGVDDLGGPLNPEAKARLEQESQFLRREILNYPDFVTPPPAS